MKTIKWIKQHWRSIVRVIGVIMVVASAFIAYLWFYKIGPLRHTLEFDWLRYHSTEAYWNEVKISIRRFGWMHDDWHPTGHYGDKEFMAWAISHMPYDDSIFGCFGGHRDNAYRLISNQNAGQDANEWLAWWEKNKSKSQAEWIRDGFTSYGVTVSISSSSSDTIPLLTLLGNSSTNLKEMIPGFVKYNAFRWLRDSEFNPVAFAISNVTQSSNPPIKDGLLLYLQWERIWPKSDRVGGIRFDAKIDPYWGGHPPEMLKPGFKAKVYALIFGLPCIGFALIIWTHRKRNLVNIEPTESHKQTL